MAFPLAALGVTVPGWAWEGKDRPVLDRPNLLVFAVSGAVFTEGRDALNSGGTGGGGLRWMADHGVLLERCYGGSSAVVSRGMWLTARDPLQSGVQAAAERAHVLHQEEVTVAEILRALGYETEYFGSWGLGGNAPHRPEDQGFGVSGGAAGAEPGMLAAQWLGENGDARPLFGVVCVEAGTTGELNEVMAPVLMWVKGGISREARTVILLLGEEGDRGGGGERDAAGGSLSEAALRLPCVWVWPGIFPAGMRVDEIAHLPDVGATLIALAGGELPRDRAIQGMDLTALLMFGNVEPWPNRSLGSVWVPGFNLGKAAVAYRTRRWLAISDGDWQEEDTQAWEERHWRIFDLVADPEQRYPVQEIYPFVLARMRSDATHWYQEMTVMRQVPVPIQIGRADCPGVILEAASARSPEGWIYREKRRSGLREWDAPGYAAEWVLESRGEGTYEVEVCYAAEAAVAGTLGVNGVERELRLAAAEEETVREAGEVWIPKGAVSVQLGFAGLPEGLTIRSLTLRRTDPVPGD